jgi:2'-5' RNA ligase
MSAMEQIRSFIAIELPGELKLAISRLQERLKSGSRAPVRWVRSENTHLTLKFLGDIDPAVVDDIRNALAEAVKGISAVRLGAEGLGVFPGSTRVQVIWVGLTGELDKLKKLQQRIDKELIPLGFPAERRPFSPHLTIARLRDRANANDRQDVGRLVENNNFESGLNFLVRTINLMKSQLTPEGPVYSKLGTANLG